MSIFLIHKQLATLTAMRYWLYECMKHCMSVLDFLELKSVSELLGVAPLTLYKALTLKSRLTRGQVFKTVTDQITVSLPLYLS